MDENIDKSEGKREEISQHRLITCFEKFFEAQSRSLISEKDGGNIVCD